MSDDRWTAPSGNLPGMGTMVAAGIGVGVVVGALVAKVASNGQSQQDAEAQALLARLKDAARRLSRREHSDGRQA